jgi:hypothetical protein
VRFSEYIIHQLKWRFALRSLKVTLTTIETIANAWASMAPGESFYGRTLEQFRAEIKPMYDLCAEAAESERRTAGIKAKRADAAVAASQLGQNIVQSVKAAPTHGKDSPLYAAMGFVRESARSSGLRRGNGKQEVKAKE